LVHGATACPCSHHPSFRGASSKVYKADPSFAGGSQAVLACAIVEELAVLVGVVAATDSAF